MSEETPENKVQDPAKKFREALGRTLFSSSPEALKSFVDRAEPDDPNAPPAPPPEPAPAAEPVRSRPPMSLADLAAATQERLEEQKKRAAAGKLTEDDDAPDQPNKAPPKPTDHQAPQPSTGDEPEPPVGDPPAAPAQPDKPVKPVKVVKRESPPLASPPIKDEDVDPPPAPKPKTLEERLGFDPNEDEREYFEALEYAEQLGDDRYAGVFERETKRVREVREFVAKWEAQHPGEIFNPDFDDATRAAYNRLRQEKKPALTKRDIRDIEHRRIADDVRRQVQAETQETARELKRQVGDMRERPMVEKLTNEIINSAVESLPEEFKLIVRQRGIEALAEADPVIGAQVAGLLSNARDAIRDYMLIHRGVLEPQLGTVVGGDIVGANPLHEWISNALAACGAHFRENGGNMRIRDGKEFLAPGQYTKLARQDPKLAKSKYWTWTPEEGCNVLAGVASGQALKAIQIEQEKLKKGGYQKAAPQSGEKPKPAPAPSGDLAPQPPSPRVPPKPAGSAPRPPRKSLLERTLMTATNAGR